MRLEAIEVTPHSAGNRIHLTWRNPDPVAFPGVRVVRRVGTYPTSPQPGSPREGLVVADVHPASPQTVSLDETGRYHLVDDHLQGETVYYYAFFPYRDDPPQYQIDQHNRAAAMATAPYDLAGQMYSLLPAIYHRYDTARSPTGLAGMAEADQQRGQLRRFLDLPGGQLDQLYSFARALLDLYNLGRVDGRLLPLLAEWIGWQTDYRLEIDTQRNEIRNAPAIYRTIGLIPTVEATVKRISGWESRAKEFVHNVFAANRPERLNLWSRRHSSGGDWTQPMAPLSLDFAYEGRPALVQDAAGTVWCFYHTLNKKWWNIWYKQLSTFGVASSFQSELAEGLVSTDLQQAFAEAGFALSQRATVDQQAPGWTIRDSVNDEVYGVLPGTTQLNVHRWTPSQPLIERKRFDRHPATARQDERLWVFWDSYDVDSQRWRIDYRTHSDGEWSSSHIFGDDETARRSPAVVVDQAGRLWLFWLERTAAGARWQLRYNRYPGGVEMLAPGGSFVLPDSTDPGGYSDLFVLFHPTAASQRLWLFWAQPQPIAQPGQTRWTVLYRVKQGLDPAATDWSAVRTLPKADPDRHDREPAVVVTDTGDLDVFWSANRDGGWSIWQRSLAIADPNAHVWGPAQGITEPPYSQRHPLPFSVDDERLLLYRSNQSLTYSSQVYQATETFDGRYAGSTTVHTRNAAKIALGGAFGDFQTYTYDIGRLGQRSNEDWYSRDTLGLYLTPDTVDADSVAQGITRIDRVLDEFMPITDRAVFIAQPDLQTERVYTYDQPGAAEPRFIAESYTDRFTSLLEDAGLEPGEDFTDVLEP